MHPAHRGHVKQGKSCHMHQSGPRSGYFWPIWARRGKQRGQRRTGVHVVPRPLFALNFKFEPCYMFVSLRHIPQAIMHAEPVTFCPPARARAGGRGATCMCRRGPNLRSNSSSSPVPYLSHLDESDKLSCMSSRSHFVRGPGRGGGVTRILSFSGPHVRACIGVQVYAF